MTAERFLALMAFSILTALSVHTLPKAFAEVVLTCKQMEC